MDVYSDIKKAEKGAWLSIVAYLLMSALKLCVGYFANSKALLADGLNNTTDIIASVAVLIGLKISRKPPDADHPYGHFRAETIAALIASFIMALVGLQVLYQAIQSLIARETQVAPDVLAGWTAVLCAAVMYIIYRYNFRLAKKFNSQAMMAAAQDNRSDALVSVGAFIGIIGSQFGMPWLDALMALIVGGVICKTAWSIFREATHALTDGFDEQKLEVFSKTIEATPGVEAIKDIKARMYGNTVLVDVIIFVAQELNVVEGHDICEAIELRMKSEHKIMYVHVHLEPML